ncbi:MAG: VWA domain-containing protein [Planctomycetales bacterium]
MDIQIGNMSSLLWVWAVGLAVVVMVVALIVRARAISKFATPNLVSRILPEASWKRSGIRIVCLAAALLMMLAALMDVRWGRNWRDVPQKGIEVVFLLDISRSMLAEDINPNRLDRAKQQITDMLDVMEGDRAGLVVFAGRAKQQIPLTSNHHDFKLMLEEVGPHCLERGGSRLGNAIRVARSCFLEESDDHKAMVIITDGEDHESKPVEEAQDAYASQGIRTFTVGLGSMEKGARIPVRLASQNRSYLQHEGQEVWSRMNGDILKEVALAGEGAYIPAGTKQVDMGDVYGSYISSVEQTEFESARINSYIPRYPWFVGLALLVLVIDTLWMAGIGQQIFGGGRQS